MGKTESGIEKIQKAINRLEKGNVMFGLMNSELINLNKALQLATNQKNEVFQTEIRNNLFRARKLLWYKKKAITKQAKFESLNSIRVKCNEKLPPFFFTEKKTFPIKQILEINRSR